MTTKSGGKSALFAIGAAALWAATGCQSQPPAPGPEGAAAAGAVISISPDVPADIPGGAPSATLSEAAAFAWQEFIALNWPAQAGNRDVPDTTKLFGQAAGSGYDGTVVWHTYRHKVEIYPGTGNPPGYVDTPPDYGYNTPPTYNYASPINACPEQGAPLLGHPAWVNLDENSQISLDEMFAGIAPTTPIPGQEILFLAKANKAEYTYAAANQWWGQTFGKTKTTAQAISDTKTFVAANKKDPPAGSSDYVSLPNGTIEIKTAWRRLGPGEDASRFQTAPVRFYEMIKPAGTICWREDTWAMLALHIIHKTPTAPYFTYATFGQADNIRTPDGLCVEDVDGNILNPPRDCYTGAPGQNPLPPNPLSPNVTITPATPSTKEVFTLTPNQACSPGQNLYYQNSNTQLPLPGETICVQQRIHPIDAAVVQVNNAAHSAISAYNAANGLASSPWLYYKLVNIQSAPYDKPAGTIYTGPPPGGSGPSASTYYQSNIVVESDYNLQVFSGRFENFGTDNRMTDYDSSGNPFKNVLYGAEANQNGQGYNMGGCMGCHGNAQGGGQGFSFIFGFGVPGPDVAGDISSSAARIATYKSAFGSR